MGIEYICDNKTVPLVHFSVYDMACMIWRKKASDEECVESFVAVKTLRFFFFNGVDGKSTRKEKGILRSALMLNMYGTYDVLTPTL